MFGVSIFAIAFIIIAGLSLYNKLLAAVQRVTEDLEPVQIGAEPVIYYTPPNPLLVTIVDLFYIRGK